MRGPWVLLIVAAGAGCGEAGTSPCSANNPCVEGYACTAEGECRQTEALRIETEQIPEGSLGIAYEATVVARGGLPPYSWSIDAGLAWIQIDPDTGEITGTPDAPSSGTLITVEVTDTSLDLAAPATRDYQIRVTECIDGDKQPCFRAEGGDCFKGLRDCAAGIWRDCTGGLLSEEIDHCDAACTACDAVTSDRCAGVCQCGDGSPCPDGTICCAGDCIDPDTDGGNCGGCGTDCLVEVQHATEARCWGGQCIYEDCEGPYLDCDFDVTNGCETEMTVQQCGRCDRDCRELTLNVAEIVCQPDVLTGDYGCAYTACALEHHDCDGDTENGCETPVTLSDCAACGDDCLQGPVPNQNRECVLNQAGDGHHCGCDGPEDCDTGLGQQCCDGLCYDLDDPAHCGDCASNCTLDPAHPACIDPGNHTCGCVTNADCGEYELCCDNACIPMDAEHCGDCFTTCDMTNGGPTCIPSLGRCGCLEDGECNDFVGGQFWCDVGFSDICRCNYQESCYGGPNEQCCEGEPGVFDCVDTMTDPDNCGRCGVECLGGGLAECDQGKCVCSPGIDLYCPTDSPAPNCVFLESVYRCVCNAFGDGTTACPEGRYCCSGNSGGTGGPNGGPDEGCCLGTCGGNSEGDCIFQ